MPKVSIIIPIFNAESFLHKSVESCLNQTLSDIEIILVDDKSTDSSLQIARDFATLDSRICVIAHTSNQGTFLARKSGIEKAVGEFVLFLDADDWIDLNACEILHRKAVKSGADIVHFSVKFNPPSTIATKPKIFLSQLENDEILGEIFIKHFKKSYLVVATRLFRTNLVKTAIKKLDFIDCHLASSEDTALFLPLCALAKKSVGISEVAYFYTQNPASLLKSKSPSVIFKQNADRAFLRDNLVRLQNDKDLSQNRYFSQSLQNCRDLMDYFICFSSRFLSTQDAKTCISPYIKYSILSFKFILRWQIAVKLAIFILTLGKKRL